MTTSPVPQKPVVEQSPGNNSSVELTERSLRLRIRQQEILAELGVLALQGTKFIDLLNHTARLTADGLGAEYCKVFRQKDRDTGCSVGPVHLVGICR